MQQPMMTLFARYQSHHEANRALLTWIGVIGAVAFPLLYVLRQHSRFPLMFDDLVWRAVATVLCAGLALRQWWPASLRRYYLAYSYLTVFYCLAFLLPFTMLHNQATTPTIVNMVWSTMLIILLTDWRNTLVMVVGGYALSALTYWAIAPQVQLPVAFLLWWVPMCAVLVASTSASKHIEKRAELERMRRLYASLAGSIAHEMRTPLAQVQHALRRIDADVPPHSEAAHATRQAQAAIQRGLQSISITLQQINHCKPPSLALRGLSAERCVRKALDEYAYDSPQARESVSLQVDGDFGFLGDETAFELVLFNLLKNSLYYLPLKPAMTVSVMVKGSASTPCIVVRDTGPGIAPDTMPRLFEEFNTDGKAEGTGLGLSFCRRTLRAWGGDIQCNSELGHFTEFTLSFTPAPIQASEHIPSPLPFPTPSLAGRTVLIVDDQQLNRVIARAMLREMGLNVIEAEHGQQALDMLQAGAVPDAVLMDINMPGLDGLATTRLLRCLPGAAGRIPVFALTANDSASAHEAAREAGMQGLLSKPIDSQTLRLALTALL